MDVLAVSDFPDIRLKAAIQSAAAGSVLVIPREGGYLVRLYIELDELGVGERVSARNITVDDLIAAARRVLRPYTLEVKEVAWWSVYEIGQRLTDKFDDVPEDEVALPAPRVFIAGDVCHTHSPEAGQGKNVSMQDAFNLGWKLAAVIRGQSSEAILHTYSPERRGSPTNSSPLIAPSRRCSQRRRSGRAGRKRVASIRPSSSATSSSTAASRRGPRPAMRPRCSPPRPTGRILRGLIVGMRFHSAPVIRLADARPVHLGHTTAADGRWRLFLFSDEQGASRPDDSRLRALCVFLADAPASPVLRYTPAGADPDDVCDVRAVFQEPHRELPLDAMPAFLQPRKGR